MSESIEIDGKNLVPIQDVLKEVSYSRDYITRLARENKIEAAHIGRQWFIDVDSLDRYVKMAETEKEIRKQKLSLKRKQEKEIHEAVSKQKSKHKSHEQKLHARAVAMACLVLGIGLIGGGAMYSFYESGQLADYDSSRLDLAALPSTQEENENTTLGTEADAVSDVKQQEFAEKENAEVRSLGEVKDGVVLFPNGEVDDDVAEIFSDDVMIIESPDGTKKIVRRDANGYPIGNQIPFIQVPVKQDQI